MNSVVLALTGWQLLAAILVWATTSVALGLLMDWLRNRYPAVAAFKGETTPEVDPPTVQLIKIHLPSFGKPKLTTYDSSKFEIPLVCTGCSRKLEDDEEYYEIPITDGEPGSVTAVHQSCFMYALAAIPTTSRNSHDGDEDRDTSRTTASPVWPEHGSEEAAPAARRVRRRRQLPHAEVPSRVSERD